MLWILLAATLGTASSPAECLSLGEAAATLRGFPLKGMPVYQQGGDEPVDEVVSIDWSGRVPDIRLKDNSHLSSGCFRLRDLQRVVAYRVVRFEHDYDGTSCVSYEEGMPHSAVYQRLPHNKGREVRMDPYFQAESGFERMSAQAGLVGEALAFECGIQVGDQGLQELVKDEAIPHGTQLIRADSPWVLDERFKKSGSYSWNGIDFLVGTGLPLPDLD